MTRDLALCPKVFRFDPCKTQNIYGDDPASWEVVNPGCKRITLMGIWCADPKPLGEKAI